MMRLRTGELGSELNGRFGVALLGIFLWCSVQADETSSTTSSKATNNAVAKEALTQFQDLVGGWVGTGQPKRGSAAGAWREKADWRWKFAGEQAALECLVEEGKLLKSGLLSFDPEKKMFVLKAVELIDAKEETVERDYIGELTEKKLVVESAGTESTDGRRITITRLNEKRTLVLFERKAPSQNFYSRIAEVGYTREGTRLADSDQTGPVCVVTGGVGTIKVTHKGETYWVCCTGCRDAFNDDPEGVLADYKKKLEEKKAKK
ncbi:MAG: hypothetical protein NT013_13470 [Planctomycetia bacterium]|nr:hypothetical protein [Planctomycetia bacterium]